MREIKFRAWDKNKKEMIYFGKPEFYWQEESLGYYGNGYAIAFYNASFNWFNRSHIRPDLILMQYTELKDKNGVEIYEGDIIWQPFEAEYHIGVIEMNQGHWSIGQPRTGLFDVSELYEDDWKLCEIRGNIHENPGLLE